MAIPRNQKEFCSYGHDLSKTRKRQPNGKTCCFVCNREKSKNWRKQNPEKARVIETRNNLKRHYGISLDKYNEILKLQGGVCAICGEECKSGRKLSVDHDHETGVVRGLLCGRCNTAIGLLRYDKRLFASAVEYIESYTCGDY